MPIKKVDVPNVTPSLPPDPPHSHSPMSQTVHKLISTELTRSAIVRHSTLPKPSHQGLSPPSRPNFPSTAYTPIILHTALLIISKASRFHPSLIHRRSETLRQFITRAQNVLLWNDDVTREAVQVW